MCSRASAVYGTNSVASSVLSSPAVKRHLGQVVAGRAAPCDVCRPKTRAWPAARARAHRSSVLALPVAGDLDLAQALGVADHLVDGAEAQARHDLAELLGDERHEVDDVLGLAGEAAAQVAVLRGRCPPGRCPAGSRAASGSPWQSAARWRSRIPRRRAGTPRPRRGRPSACRRPPARRAQRRPLQHEASAAFRQGRAQAAGRHDRSSRAGRHRCRRWCPRWRSCPRHPWRRRWRWCPRPPRSTSLTETRAPGLAFFRSKISSAKSSIE